MRRKPQLAARLARDHRDAKGLLAGHARLGSASSSRERHGGGSSRRTSSDQAHIGQADLPRPLGSLLLARASTWASIESRETGPRRRCRWNSTARPGSSIWFGSPAPTPPAP